MTVFGSSPSHFCYQTEMEDLTLRSLDLLVHVVPAILVLCIVILAAALQATSATESTSRMPC